MTMKYSSKQKGNRMIVWGLSLIMLVLSILYLVERDKYVSRTEEIEKTTMYLYDLEIESSLKGLLYYIGTQPIAEEEWEKQEVKEIIYAYLRNIDEGIDNIESPILNSIPKEVMINLQILRETINSFNIDIENQASLDDEIKENIMNLISSIHGCKVDKPNKGWEQVVSEVTCINNDLKGN